MEKFLDEKDLPEFYSFLNKVQKNATQLNNNKIDLFIVLDVSGSMNFTSNKLINFGAGIFGFVGMFIGLDKQAITNIFNTRLNQAKKHIILQIKNLIQAQRINKLGLITFNQSARINVNLTNSFQTVIRQIENQRASGSTALYDSIVYAQKELEGSQNPRMLIMTDGQDNSSKSKFNWMEEWFHKSGLKSSFIAICSGDNRENQQLARVMHSRYITMKQKWFENSFDQEFIRKGFQNLKRLLKDSENQIIYFFNFLKDYQDNNIF